MIELHATLIEVAATAVGLAGVVINVAALRESHRVRRIVVQKSMNGPLLLQTDANVAGAWERLATVATCLVVSAWMLFVPSRHDGYAPVAQAMVAAFLLIECQVVYLSWRALSLKRRLDAAIEHEEAYRRALAERGGRRRDDPDVFWEV